MYTQCISIKNNSSPVPAGEIPVLSYEEFSSAITLMLAGEENHCLAYYAVPSDKNLRFICCIADDRNETVSVFSHLLNREIGEIRSLTTEASQLHIFERDINERYGVAFTGHPWMKPVRYSHDRYDRSKTMDNYPFYEIEGEELHEVGVGPIHAGVIEPGHFRFICNGEKVLHLEIHLGYQHRGIENIFLEKNNSLKKCIASENIAGDSAIGHSLAHAQLIESLAGIEISGSLSIERCIALELERIAVHIGDTAALCGDVAYQLGQVVCEALRTTIINTTQLWCGNRFGKGLIRPGGTNFPLTEKVADEILKVIGNSGNRYRQIADRIYSLPSLLGRFEDIGTVTKSQALAIGTVGMAARSCGIARDIRISHPFQYYRNYKFATEILSSGDVLARGMLRVKEVMRSATIIAELISQWRNIPKHSAMPVYDYKLKQESYAVGLTEGWRGEICHSAFTDEKGNITNYYIKDPSLHNWMALALAVRNQEISDFPVCNKSFNLSYCGNDH